MLGSIKTTYLPSRVNGLFNASPYSEWIKQCRAYGPSLIASNERGRKFASLRSISFSSQSACVQSLLASLRCPKKTWFSLGENSYVAEERRRLSHEVLVTCSRAKEPNCAPAKCNALQTGQRHEHVFERSIRW